MARNREVTMRLAVSLALTGMLFVGATIGWVTGSEMARRECEDNIATSSGWVSQSVVRAAQAEFCRGDNSLWEQVTL